ncbi:hypothetical protein HOG21_01805 [bacterium]|jgi:hypothetical protein|nr:hypothetical protein [bacterium]
MSIKLVGSSKNNISGDSKSILAKAIFVLCHQLTSTNFLSSNDNIQIPLATQCILLL